jgi:hypothetical protein
MIRFDLQTVCWCSPVNLKGNVKLSQLLTTKVLGARPISNIQQIKGFKNKRKMIVVHKSNEAYEREINISFPANALVSYFTSIYNMSVRCVPMQLFTWFRHHKNLYVNLGFVLYVTFFSGNDTFSGYTPFSFRTCIMFIFFSENNSFRV